VQFSTISSLHSPKIGEVKALLGSKGKKIRKEEKKFVVEGAMSVREAVNDRLLFPDGPRLDTLFITEDGEARLGKDFFSQVGTEVSIYKITDEIAASIAETENSQGIFAVATYQNWTLHRLWNRKPKRLIYLWEIQDPGNLGTIIRTAAALDYDAILLSPNSVDIYSAKVQRSSVGSFFHIPTIGEISLNELLIESETEGFQAIALANGAEVDLTDYSAQNDLSALKSLAIFGNEARGLPDEIAAMRVRIKQTDRVESLNLSIAVALTMNALSPLNIG
jgi:RNA methyltransferase, TrmH family